MNLENRVEALERARERVAEQMDELVEFSWFFVELYEFERSTPDNEEFGRVVRHLLVTQQPRRFKGAAR